jgi:hypothetical protein
MTFAESCVFLIRESEGPQPFDIWLCVVGQAFPDVSKDRGSFIFNGYAVQKGGQSFWYSKTV